VCSAQNSSFSVTKARQRHKKSCQLRADSSKNRKKPFFLFLFLEFAFRSRRKARQDEKRIRIRPCLSVCQTVEQKCPYMLPADRAPAYPTQYAGEPTFLCLGKLSSRASGKEGDRAEAIRNLSVLCFPGAKIQIFRIAQATRDKRRPRMSGDGWRGDLSH
jgi:hypothetical protein